MDDSKNKEMDSSDQTLSKEISEDFGDFNRPNFPLQFPLQKDLELNTNNSFNAVIHCLSNIKKLSFFVLNSENKNDIYKSFLLKGKNNEHQAETMRAFKELKDYIFNKINSQTENLYPQKIIEFILKELKENNLLPKDILTTFKCESNNQEITDLNFIKFDIPKVIKYIEENNKINNKNINMKDCFDYYFNSFNDYYVFGCDELNSINGNKFIKTLPKILIIFINYGKDKNACYDYSYEFKEEINSKDFYENDEEGKKYFLSSIIACKNLGNYFELFYTFIKDEEKLNYIILNGKDVNRTISKVTNKLKKEKINLKDKKQSWPFVLIYVDKKIDNFHNSYSDILLQ